MVATEDATAFNANNLAQFEAVVFLNTTGDVLNATQQFAFEAYVEAGGGFVGVHSAADTEYNWPWYGQLVGAYFASHPAIQSATISVADKSHPSTAGLPDRWVRTDEWYNYQLNPRGAVHVLATLDETTYSGGTMGFDHPIAWCQHIEQGRSWYTGLGHTAASYSEPLFRQHLLGGIRFVAGTAAADAGGTVWSKFNKVVLDDDTLDPMQLDVAADGRVFFVERAGTVKVWEPSASSTRVIGQIPVVTTSEDGLLGIALDPGFATNQWLYVFYSAVGAAEQHVSRFTVVDGQLDMGSERILLRVPVQRSNSNHSGGALGFGPGGVLYVALGDNTSPFASDGYAPIDERPGRSDWDAQKSSSNTHDLRGKILRIKPEADGSYSIPPGNLFAADGSQGRPEIYIMGNRNPFRFTVDSETGWLYWGEVGPDAGGPHPLRGPAGHDEWNQARAAGNYGWPYFVGDNKPYVDFNFATNESGPPFNSLAPQNNSPNNTGSLNLPPARPAWIWYPYSTSPEFPELGVGGRTAMSGPVYHYDASLASDRKLPAYYDDTLFIYEWSRNWIKEVKLDAAGNVLAINPFVPNMQFRRPMDMKRGPDGALYMLEWGSGFGGGNADSQLIRIDYHAPLSPPTITGTPDDDAFYVRRVDSQLHIYQNTPPVGLPTYSFEIAELNGPLTIDAGGGNDVLRVNAAGGDLQAALIFESRGGVNTLVIESGRANVDSTLAAGGVLNTTVSTNAHLSTARIDQNALVLENNSKLLLGPHANASRLTSLSVGAGATLDVGSSALVLDYTGDSPLATIREKILSGRGGPGLGATWTGTGITSSEAAVFNQTAPDSRSVGFAENALLPLRPYTIYRGVTIDETSILIAFVPTADATLDGLINDNDVTIVGATYEPGHSNPSWALGDFDYNGFVDDDDVTLLGALYQRSAPVPAPLTDEGLSTKDEGRRTKDEILVVTGSPERATAAPEGLNATETLHDRVADARLGRLRRTRIADEFWPTWP